jgi:hypothetical protein
MTEEIKYSICTLTSVMLREKRLSIRKPLLSENPTANAKKLNEELNIYSLQFKVGFRLFCHLFMSKY